MAVIRVSSQFPVPYREPYHSCPLLDQRNHIRLLVITAPERPDDDEEEIQALLRVVSLDSLPTYTALSHVWGSGTDDDPFIRCGSAKISVTKTCFAALKYMRNRSPIAVWIDAVCVDQQNEAEKLAQIGLMDTIYSKAQYVYVWLDHGDKDRERFRTNAQYWVSSSILIF